MAAVGTGGKQSLWRLRPLTGRLSILGKASSWSAAFPCHILVLERTRLVRTATSRWPSVPAPCRWRPGSGRPKGLVTRVAYRVKIAQSAFSQRTFSHCVPGSVGSRQSVLLANPPRTHGMILCLVPQGRPRQGICMKRTRHPK
ncbi:hypothetical protein L209DRAFT_514712 [Thermothelomyces heterothallicus CBS 203.75]